MHNLNPEENKIRQRSRQKQKQRKNPIIKFFKTPKGLVLTLLIIMLAIAVAASGDMHPLVNVGVALITAILVELAAGMILKKKRLFPDGGIITALIISLIIGGLTPWFEAASVTAIALLSKHFLSYNRKPVFNPAAFGLLAALLIFQTNQSWWGAFTALPFYFIPVLVIIGYFAVSKVNKFPQVFSYLGLYFLLFALMAALNYQNIDVIFRSPYINAVLFLAFIMLTDPPTTPALYREQVLFGFLASSLSIVFYILFGGLYFLPAGLLAANLVKAFLFGKQRQIVRKTA